MARRSGSRFATAGVRRNNFEICKPKRAGGHEQHRGSGLVPLLSPSRIRTERDIEHAAGLRISPVSRPQIRRPCPSSRFPRRWACRNRRASPQALVPSVIGHYEIALSATPNSHQSGLGIIRLRLSSGPLLDETRPFAELANHSGRQKPVFVFFYRTAPHKGLANPHRWHATGNGRVPSRPTSATRSSLLGNRLETG